MAFPSRARKLGDPFFIQPYKSEDFSKDVNQGAKLDCQRSILEEREVRTGRTSAHGFLFRIDPHPHSGSAIILVQSAASPDWDYAFQNAAVLLGAKPEVRNFEPEFQIGDKKRFCVLANPVRKVSKNSLDFSGNLFDPKWIGKDIPVPVRDLENWLERRAEPLWQVNGNSSPAQTPPGFEILSVTDIQSGYVYVNKGQDQNTRKIRSARYEGILRINHPDHFKNTLIKGIGPAKAFGFGLITLSNVAHNEAAMS